MDKGLEELSPSDGAPSLRFPWPEPKRYALWQTVTITVVICFWARYAGVLAKLLEETMGITDDPRKPGIMVTPSPGVDPTQSVAIGVWATTIVGLLLLWFFARLRPPIGEYVGTTLPKARQILKHCLCLTAGFLALIGSYRLFGLAPALGPLALLTDKPVFPAALAVTVIFMAPVFEEALFRGFLFTGLARSRMGPWAAIIIAAVLWTATDLARNAWGGIPVALGLGVYFGWARLRTGSIWLPIILHSVWNGLCLAAALIAVQVWTQ